jgi:hypothetical protein
MTPVPAEKVQDWVNVCRTNPATQDAPISKKIKPSPSSITSLYFFFAAFFFGAAFLPALGMSFVGFTFIKPERA